MRLGMVGLWGEGAADRRSGGERPHHPLAEAVDRAHAAGDGAVEEQGRIGLEEMIVAADLDRPVAGVGDEQGDVGQVGIELDRARQGKDFAGDHRAAYRMGWWTVTSLVPSGKVASTWT